MTEIPAPIIVVKQQLLVFNALFQELEKVTVEKYKKIYREKTKVSFLEARAPLEILQKCYISVFNKGCMCIIICTIETSFKEAKLCFSGTKIHYLSP